jgi:hypothetical protein
MTLGEQRRKALELLAPPPSRHDQRRKVLELLAPPPSRHDHSDGGIPRQSGSASSKPSIIGVLAERHARYLAERARTLQDACKPMHTDPSTIWVICYQRTTQERRPTPPLASRFPPPWIAEETDAYVLSLACCSLGQRYVIECCGRDRLGAWGRCIRVRISLSQFPSY